MAVVPHPALSLRLTNLQMLVVSLPSAPLPSDKGFETVPSGALTSSSARSRQITRQGETLSLLIRNRNRHCLSLIKILSNQSHFPRIRLRLGNNSLICRRIIKIVDRRRRNLLST